MIWSDQAEQVVAKLIAGLSPAQLDPRRTHAARLGALPIGGSMWADYYLRPDGAVVVVGVDWDHPEVDTVLTDRIDVVKILVWGSKRYPALRALLPVRPPGAVDCPCQGTSFLLCSTCGAIGWVPPADG